MKIIKVVVKGVVPKNCFVCPIMDEQYFCPLELTATLETDFDKRPDWCPLVSTDDLMVSFEAEGWIVEDPDSGWEEW